MAHVPRQEGHHAAHEGQQQHVRLARVDSGRTVCARVAFRWTRWHGQAVAVSHRRWQRSAADNDSCRSTDAQNGRCGVRQRPALSVVRGAQRRLAIQQHRRAVPVVCVGQGVGTRIADVNALWLGLPPSAVPRRKVSRLRHALRDQDGAPHSRSADAAGRLARLPRATRRYGISRADGCLSGLLVHPRFKGHCRQLWRRDLARAGRQERAGQDPLRSRSEARDGSRGEVRVQGRHRADVQGPTDPRHCTVARWQNGRVFCTWPHLHDAVAEWHTNARDQWRHR